MKYLLRKNKGKKNINESARAHKTYVQIPGLYRTNKKKRCGHWIIMEFGAAYLNQPVTGTGIYQGRARRTFMNILQYHTRVINKVAHPLGRISEPVSISTWGLHTTKMLLALGILRLGDICINCCIARRIQYALPAVEKPSFF